MNKFNNFVYDEDENALKLLSEEPDDDWNDPDDKPITKEEISLAEDLFDLIQGIIDTEVYEDFTEEFKTHKSLVRHFNKHCLAGDTSKKSKYTNIYYDFNNIDKYRVYEEKIADKVENNSVRILSMYDTQKVTNAFRKLFEGNVALHFSYSCDFHNDAGNISVGIYAFSSNVTNNYVGGNTVDILVQNRKKQTVTLYPVDAHYLQTKFNNIIKEHSGFVGKFEFNND